MWKFPADSSGAAKRRRGHFHPIHALAFFGNTALPISREHDGLDVSFNQPISLFS
jgi:hypothetical protein